MNEWLVHWGKCKLYKCNCSTFRSLNTDSSCNAIVKVNNKKINTSLKIQCKREWNSMEALFISIFMTSGIVETRIITVWCTAIKESLTLSKKISEAVQFSEIAIHIKLLFIPNFMFLRVNFIHFLLLSFFTIWEKRTSHTLHFKPIFGHISEANSKTFPLTLTVIFLPNQHEFIFMINSHLEREYNFKYFFHVAKPFISNSGASTRSERVCFPTQSV